MASNPFTVGGGPTPNPFGSYDATDDSNEGTNTSTSERLRQNDVQKLRQTYQLETTEGDVADDDSGDEFKYKNKSKSLWPTKSI
jgi:hypothetical protein